jgi:hypothetical protein
MNNNGQVQFYAFMLGLVVIILALGLAFSTREAADNAMSNTTTDFVGMDCSNSSISSFQKISCYAADLTPFYFVGSLIMIGGIILISKIIFD